MGDEEETQEGDQGRLICIGGEIKPPPYNYSSFGAFKKAVSLNCFPLKKKNLFFDKLASYHPRAHSLFYYGEISIISFPNRK